MDVISKRKIITPDLAPKSSFLYDGKGDYYQYIERKKGDRFDEIKFHGKLENYPDELKKKIRIL